MHDQPGGNPEAGPGHAGQILSHGWPTEELEEIAGEREVWALPAEPRQAEVNGWIDGRLL